MRHRSNVMPLHRTQCTALRKHIVSNTGEGKPTEWQIKTCSIVKCSILISKSSACMNIQQFINIKEGGPLKGQQINAGVVLIIILSHYQPISHVSQTRGRHFVCGNSPPDYCHCQHFKMLLPM